MDSGNPDIKPPPYPYGAVESPTDTGTYPPPVAQQPPPYDPNMPPPAPGFVPAVHVYGNPTATGGGAGGPTNNYGYTYNSVDPMSGYGGGNAGGYDDDVETAFKNDMGFSSKAIRMGFIRKVFAIIFVQLLVVLGLICLCMFESNTNKYIRTDGIWLYWTSYGIFLVSYLMISCCQSVRRKVPGNYICLVILTVSLGFMAAMISSIYDTKIVLMAMGISAFCCFGVIVFSIQTRFDFTKWVGVLAVAGLVLFFFGILAIVFGLFLHQNIVFLVYAALAALLFMGYLAVDIQMLMGGRKLEIDPEDYVYAATQIFVDVVMIFMYILALVGGGSRS